MSGISEGLGRKIGSARDLQSIVRSMKALAASNIGQYERAVAALYEYYRTVELAVRACSGAVAPPSLPRTPAGTGSVGVVIFGSDQGLVGRFNEVLAEFAISTLGAMPGRITRIWTVGERMETLVAGPTRLYPVPNSVDGIGSLVGEILIDIAAAEEAAKIREVYVFHNAPQEAALYTPMARRLLPLDNPLADRDCRNCLADCAGTRGDSGYGAGSRGVHPGIFVHPIVSGLRGVARQRERQSIGRDATRGEEH